MQYIRTIWVHDFPDFPVEIYSEIDEERWEVRKVEIFRDGSATYADLTRSTGKTGLSEDQQKLATAIATASKKFPNAVLMKCASEECWYALAKLGFGIVKLDYQ